MWCDRWCWLYNTIMDCTKSQSLLSSNSFSCCPYGHARGDKIQLVFLLVQDNKNNDNLESLSTAMITADGSGRNSKRCPCAQRRGRHNASEYAQLEGLSTSLFANFRKIRKIFEYFSSYGSSWSVLIHRDSLGNACKMIEHSGSK